MRFNWDPDKDSANRRKHRVSFEEATLVFLDSNRLETFDDRHDEPRWVVLGVIDRHLFVVVYALEKGEENAEENESIRLISARRANAQERKTYREFRD